MTKTSQSTAEAPLQLSDLHVSMRVQALGQIGHVVAVDAGEQTVLVRAKAWDDPVWCRLSELRRAPAEAPPAVAEETRLAIAEARAAYWRGAYDALHSSEFGTTEADDERGRVAIKARETARRKLARLGAEP